VSLKGNLIHAVRGINEYLLNLRQGLECLFATGIAVGRHHTPALHVQTFGKQFFFETAAGSRGKAFISIEEYHTNGIRISQCEADIAGNCAQETVRFADEEAAAVTTLAVGCNSAAVGEACQCANGGIQQPMTGFAVHMGNQPETTVISFEFGPVEA
jgi:hypothetical protein